MAADRAVPDQAERDVAAASLQDNVVVLAGAGTGKTTLLVDRLTLLILGAEIPVERIVALTFTKKAAEEMRVRLESRLRAIVGGEEPPALLRERFASSAPRWAELAARALEDIPKAQIGTIHSFAGHLLRLYPLQAGVDPSFREDDGAVFESIFERQWTDWLAVELGEDAPRSSAWREILKTVPVADLRELAGALAASSVDTAALSAAELNAAARGWAGALAALLDRSPVPARAPALARAADAMRAAFADAADGRPVDPALDEEMDGGKASSQWDEADQVLFSELLRTARRLTAVNEALIASAVALIAPVVDAVRSEMRRQGAVGFDGLLLFARNLLRDHPDVRADLKRRFATFLVDEFQDTDPLQGEIVFYLAEEPETSAPGWREARLGRGRLFVVGDPKQSIYRFRGADMAAFQEFEQAMTAQGAVRATLSANFRSEAPLLSFVNAFFPSVMTEEPFLQPPYVPLQPGRGNGGQNGPCVEIFRVVPPEDVDKVSADDARRAEAEAVCDWIEAQAAAEPDAARPYAYRDIACLLRTATAFRPYLEAFRRRGIPYLAEGEKSFFAAPEVIDFLNLVSAIADPEDRLSLVGVLRSPVGGLTDGEILTLKEAGALDYRETPAVLKDKVDGLYATLRSLSLRSFVSPVDEVLEAALDESGLRELSSRSSGGEQALANLAKVVTLAGAWSETEPLTLEGFVRRFRRSFEEARDEGENPLADAGFNAVKVLSVHKSKGLEFPVVFLPNLGAKTGGDRSGPPVTTDWRSGRVGLRLPRAKAINGAQLLLEAEIRRREEAEEVRVFYVAATRAKMRMICFLSEDRETGPAARYFRTAGAWPEGPVVSLGPCSVPSSDLVAGGEPASGNERPVLQLGDGWDADRLAARWASRLEDAGRVAASRPLVSPSFLGAEPEKRVIPADDGSHESREDAIAIGLLCHHVLEHWDFGKAPSAARLKASVERAARQLEIGAADASGDRLKVEANAILADFIASDVYRDLASARIVARELPFVYPLGAADADGPRAMRGVIDLVYESAGGWVIADYKTGPRGERTIDDLRRRYGGQAEAYRDALKKAAGRSAAFELIFLRERERVRF